MIVFNLITKHHSLAKLAAEKVLKEKMAMNVFIDEEITELSIMNDKLNEGKSYRLIFLTKGMLFDDIEFLLNEFIPENDFRYYSTPVTQISNDLASNMRKSLINQRVQVNAPTNPS